MMMLVEKGRCSMDDPVKRYLPEFGHLSVRKPANQLVPADSEMTNRAPVEHDLGIPTFHANQTPQALMMKKRMLRAAREGGRGIPSKPQKKLLSCRWNLNRAADSYMACRWMSSRAHRNHIGRNGSRSICPGAVQTAWHDRYGVFCSARKETTFHMLAEQTSAGFSPAAPNVRSPLFSPPAYEPCGDGLISSLADYSKFMLMLTDGKNGGSEQLIRMGTLRRMATAVSPEITVPFIREIPFLAGYGYGLGVRVMIDPGQSQVPMPAPANSDGTAWRKLVLCLPEKRAFDAFYDPQRLPSLHTTTIPPFYRLALDTFA
jgi:CubicO group peptidase (beta-lactamase class C family)